MKYMKKISASLLIREMQIKITLRFCLILVRLAVVKKANNKKCWQGFREKELLFTLFLERMQTISATMQISMEAPLKIINRSPI
jgi:hypothetical protein